MSLETPLETSLIFQRRKIESDALKMREFLAEGDVSHFLRVALISSC
jgi:exosome complex RNA-binding protein Rrp4